MSESGAKGVCSCGEVLIGAALVKALLRINKEAHDHIDDLKKKVVEVEEFRGLIAGILDDLPFPAWLHPVTSLDWYLNKAYCERFGIEPREFWEPINIMSNYPLETVTELIKFDMDAIRRGDASTQMMAVPRLIMENVRQGNPMIDVRVTKFPIITEGDAYVFGVILPD